MANRYWIAGSSALWNDTANWSTSSGGAGGASVPGSSDAAIFDANGIGKCTVDATVSVASLTLGSGYTGAGADDGHFDADTFDVTTSGNQTCDNKQISMGSGTWTCAGVHDTKDVTTLNAETSTLILSGSSKNWGVGGNYNNVNITGTITQGAGSDSGRNVSGILNVTGTLNYNNINTIGVTGDLRIQSGGTVNISFATAVVWCPSLTVLDGTLTGDGTLYLRNLSGSSVITPGNYGCNVEVAASGADCTWAPSSGTYTFAKDVTYSSTASRALVVNKNTNNPDFVYQGDVTKSISGTFTVNKGTGTTTLSGSASQAIDFDGQTLEDIDIDKSSGTVTFSGSEPTFDSFLLSQGTVNLNGVDITTVGNFQVLDAGQFSGDQGGSLVSVGGNLNLAGASGDLLVINHLDWDVTGTAVADWCDVTDSWSRGTAISSTNSDNNGKSPGWNFDAEQVRIPATVNISSNGEYLWTNESNLTNDGTSTAETETAAAGDDLVDTLLLTNFGFAIPTDATIDGILVTLADVNSNGGANASNNVALVQLIVGGTQTGTDKGDAHQLSDTTPEDVDYGGATDKWGLTPTYTQINASNFGVAVQFNLNDGDSIELGTVRITVYYTAGGGGGLSIPIAMYHRLRAMGA